MGEKGVIDYLISFEVLEAARFIDWLKPQGVVITNTQKLIPTSVSGGDGTYPDDAEIETTLRSRTDNVVYVDALEIARRLGNTRLVNTIVLGALSTYLETDPSAWLNVIERRVPPKYVELNRQAFWEGRQALA
jgi:indolepyruvate ferredoxin oxidoreductase beta subunit